VAADEAEIACPTCGATILDIDVRCGSCGAALTSTGAQRRIGSVVLDSYRVVDVLGQGGMSVVYRGTHKLTGQEVALKILPPELAAHAQVKSRFVEEARALAQLDHPHIVHLYNFGQDDDCFVLAMQFVHGRTWERMILEGGIDWRTSVRIAIDVADALDYAHSRKIIHRDMKPSNVLVRTDGSATVMDFGIAKMTTSTRLTATGQTMGTVRYMSPEQVRGGDLDLRTDLYSLAASLYESLTGATPFDGDSHFEIMTAHLSKPAPGFGDRAPGVPPALEKLVLAALAKAPADRPPTAAAFREALEAILDGKTPALPLPSTVPTRADLPAPPTRRARGPARGLALGLAGLVVAGAAATAVWLAGRGGRPEPRPTPAVAAAAPRWPAPFTLPELRFAIDQTFAGDEIRVQSVDERPAGELRDAFVAAQDAFFRLLAERGVEGVERQPLNVVVVPRTVLCDRRIYERGNVLPGCDQAGMFLRLKEKTAFLADRPERLAADLAQAAATNVCLHAATGGCEAALERYLDGLDQAARGTVPSPK
jgi:eukaryotic-like serine/threonine-protein kinase